MARMGVFSRNDDTPESIPRSLQILTHRKTFDAKYMEIYPNYCEVLQPNESVRLNVTNFLRTIPMNTPQLSRVRVVQRFYAVPFRIMWQPWENWIKGDDDTQFQYELPYLCNVNSSPYNAGFSYSQTPFGETEPSFFTFPRSLTLNSSHFVDSTIGTPNLVCGVHELGDYLGYPLFTNMSIGDSDHKPLIPHAFKACAYQLCYSYGYRSPNVQARTDDYYEMQQNNKFNNGSISTDDGNQSYEFPSLFAYYNADNGTVTPPDYSQSYNRRDSIVGAWQYTATDSDKASIVRSSWDKVEHFPLKAGPNISMLAQDVDSTTGLPKYVESNISLYRMRFANWQTDYFTSSNPWQQRGDEAQIPVTGSVQVDLSDATVNITSTFSGNSSTSYASNVDYWNPEQAEYVSRRLEYYRDDTFAALGGYVNPEDTNNWARIPVSFTPTGNVTSTGTVGTAGTTASVNGLYVSPSAFRFAMALQHIKELTAQTDNRYKSYMRKIFGVEIADNRIDRPEFLGGSVQELNVSDVVQTSESTDSSPLGTLGGRGVSAKTSRGIHFFAREHTVIIGLLHIIPDTEYLQGLSREDNVHDRFDFPLPQFTRLSEQPVYNYELSSKPWWVSSNHDVFGYEPIYNELRWHRNLCVGAFRDLVNQTGSKEWYKPWILTRDFGYSVATTLQSSSIIPYLANTQPTLSDKFLSGRYGVDYSNFVVSNPKKMYPFIVDSYFDVRATRIIPTRGLPSKLG